MDNLHNKYDLRPRDKTSSTNPPKNLLARNKENEAVGSKSPTEVQVAQIKQVETKEMQMKKMENKEVEVQNKELKKSTGMC